MNKYFLATVTLFALQASNSAAFSHRLMSGPLARVAGRLQTRLQGPQAQTYIKGTQEFLHGSHNYKKAFAKQAVRAGGKKLLWAGGCTAFAGTFGHIYSQNTDDIYLRPETKQTVQTTCKKITNTGMLAVGLGSLVLFPGIMTTSVLSGLAYCIYASSPTKSKEEIRNLELRTFRK